QERLRFRTGDKSMYVQLNCVIVDANAENRQELATFLNGFGVNVLVQLPGPDALPQILGRPDAPQLAIINLDPGAHESLKKIGHLPRQFSATSFFLMSELPDANL